MHDLRIPLTVSLAFLVVATGCGGGGAQARGMQDDGLGGLASAGASGDADTDTTGGGGGTGGASDAGATGSGPGAGGTGTGGASDDGGPLPPLFDVGVATGAEPPTTCDPVEFQVVPPRPQVGLVLDYSGSMMFDTEYQGQSVSQWEAAWKVSVNMVDATDDKIDYGAVYFPDTGSCGVSGVALPVAQNTSGDLAAALPAFDSKPTGGTPMYGALTSMRQHLGDVEDGRPQAMVLLTDGLPNCGNGSPDPVQDVVDLIEEARVSDGIRTYVVGFAAGANSSGPLNEMAEAGGTALGGATKYYEAADGDALASALEQIVIDAIPCTLDLPEPASMPEYVEVSAGGTKWAQVDDCNGPPGWTWSVEYEQITLCGLACDFLRQTGEASVTFACPAG